MTAGRALVLCAAAVTTTACLAANPAFDPGDATSSAGPTSTGAATPGTPVDTDPAVTTTDPTADPSTDPTNNPTIDPTIDTTTVATDALTDTSDPSTGAPPPGCDGVFCGAHASCAAGVCVCDDGWTGDGQTCADIDECTDAPCRSGTCINQDGTYVCAFPQSCAQMKQLDPAAGDGDYMLFHAGDAAKPWTAYCHDMAGLRVEYLTLPSQGDDQNVARYVKNGNEAVTSRYQRIRIIPNQLQVDIGDATFAKTEGMALHDGDVPVTSIAYGVAMTCNATVTTANIDLVGTPFRVVSGFCTTGNMANGKTDALGGGKSFTNTGGGACGWQTPQDGQCPYNPFSGAGGLALRLDYDP